jgi:hypothetical protein
MAKARRSSIRKRGKAALAFPLALGAAGASLAMTGGASATAPTTDVSSQDNARRLILAEEEISDVSLATFMVFDKENPPRGQGIRVAAGCGHGGGCGCGHGGGCGGCAHGGGCGGCARAGVGCAHAGVGIGCAVGGCAHPGGCAGRCAFGGRCRCAGGCGCSGVFIGVGCLGCAGCSGTCWQWDPYLGQWVSVCY